MRLYRPVLVLLGIGAFFVPVAALSAAGPYPVRQTTVDCDCTPHGGEINLVGHGFKPGSNAIVTVTGTSIRHVVHVPADGNVRDQVHAPAGASIRITGQAPGGGSIADTICGKKRSTSGPSLPFTGGPIAAVAAGGVVALAAGATIVFVARRRRA